MYITVNTWLSDNKKMKGLKKPIMAALFGGNVGHSSLNVVLEQNKESEKLIRELLEDNTKLKIKMSETITAKGDGKPTKTPVYEIYFSFWPGDEKEKNYLHDFTNDIHAEREGHKAHLTELGRKLMTGEAFDANESLALQNMKAKNTSHESLKSMMTDQVAGELNKPRGTKQVFSGPNFVFHSTGLNSNDLAQLEDRIIENFNAVILDGITNLAMTQERESDLVNVSEELSSHRWSEEIIDYTIAEYQHILNDKKIDYINKHIVREDLEKLRLLKNGLIEGLSPESSIRTPGRLNGEYGYHLGNIVKAMHEIANNDKFKLTKKNCTTTALQALLAGITPEMKQDMIAHKAPQKLFEKTKIVTSPAILKKKAMKLESEIFKYIARKQKALKNKPVEKMNSVPVEPTISPTITEKNMDAAIKTENVVNSVPNDSIFTTELDLDEISRRLEALQASLANNYEAPKNSPENEQPITQEEVILNSNDNTSSAEEKQTAQIDEINSEEIKLETNSENIVQSPRPALAEDDPKTPRQCSNNLIKNVLSQQKPSNDVSYEKPTNEESPKMSSNDPDGTVPKGTVKERMNFFQRLIDENKANDSAIVEPTVSMRRR